MKKINIIFTAVIFILGVIYLTLPAPVTPDLDNSARSDEPGDTWQHPDQKGFYTNRERHDVLSEMQLKFSLSLANLIIPSYRLNYRPEETAEFVRDQLPANYLEEIVHPLRESIFINGWEPINSPRFANLAPDDIPEMTFKNESYLSKVTLRPVYSSVWARLVVWVLVFPATYLTYLSLKRSLYNGKG